MEIRMYTTRVYNAEYRLDIDEAYLKDLNEYFHSHVMEEEAQNIFITQEDVKNIMQHNYDGLPEAYIKNKYHFFWGSRDHNYEDTIYDFIYEMVNQDLYEAFYDESCEDEYDTSIEVVDE